jgi:hypothetical protein
MSAAQIAFDMELVEAFECRENECREAGRRLACGVPGGVCAEGVWAGNVLERKVRYYRLPTDEPSS